MLEKTTATATVYVVDDCEEIRNSVHWTLSNVGYLVQTFDNAATCLKCIDTASPTCIVVDLLLPGMTGLRFCQELCAMRANCAVVMISGHGDVVSAVEAMKLGVVDFLEKPFSREHLLRAVDQGIELTRQRHQEIREEDEVAERLRTLSPREREVLENVAAGLVTKQIAGKLGISPRTVDVHRSNIAQKLQIDSPSQLSHIMMLRSRRQSRGKGERPSSGIALSGDAGLKS